MSDGDGGDTDFTVGETLTSGPYSGTFAGTYTDAGVTYVVIYQDANTAYILSPNDLATTQTALDNTISQLELNTGTFPVCFAAGTLIATPDGARCVETLSIGDCVLTLSGAATEIRWIGRQTISTLFGSADRLMPVRLAAGSLGGGLPQSDLTVTADHALLIDGVLCHAGALVNGATITHVPLDEMGDSFTVYHVETEAHDIIIANGVPAETFIDNVSRRAFDNFAEYDALYGDIPEMDALLYPRAMSARQVPQTLRARLNIRAVA